MMRSSMLVLGLSWGFLAQGASFSYVVKHVPPEQGDCHALARKLGDDVAAATGVTIKRAICTSQSASGANLLVDYAADAELDLVSTVPMQAGVDAGGGIFATLADCGAALPAELARFTAATGLSPVFAACTIDPYGEQPYAVKIDAFGTAAVPPQGANWRIFGLPVGVTGEELAATVRAGLLARGFALSYVAYKEAAFDGILVANYYAAAAAGSLDVAHTDNEAECLAAVHDAQAVFAQHADAGALTTLCSYDQFLAQYNVTTLTAGADGLTATPAVERFEGYASCQAARAELTRHYRDDIHRPVIGSVCGKGGDEAWAVVLFERN